MFVKVVPLLSFIVGTLRAEVLDFNAGSTGEDNGQSCSGSSIEDELSLIQVFTKIHKSRSVVHEKGAQTRARTDKAPGLPRVAPATDRSDNAVGTPARHRMSLVTTRTGRSNMTSLATVLHNNGTTSNMTSLATVLHNNGTTSTRTVHGKGHSNGTSPAVPSAPLSVMERMEGLMIAGDDEWSLLPVALATTRASGDAGHRNRTSQQASPALLSVNRTEQPMSMEPLGIGGVDFPMEVVIAVGVLVLLLLMWAMCCSEYGCCGTYFRMCCPWTYLRYMTCMHCMKEWFHL